MNIARKVVTASAAAVFLMPDEPSTIFEAENNAVFHNGYHSQIILVVFFAFPPYMLSHARGPYYVVVYVVVSEQHSLACTHHQHLDLPSFSHESGGG